MVGDSSSASPGSGSCAPGPRTSSPKLKTPSPRSPASPSVKALSCCSDTTAATQLQSHSRPKTQFCFAQNSPIKNKLFSVMVILQSRNISYLVLSTGLTQSVPGTIYTALVGKAFVAYFYLTVCESTCVFIISSSWGGVLLTPLACCGSSTVSYPA